MTTEPAVVAVWAVEQTSMDTRERTVATWCGDMVAIICQTGAAMRVATAF